jgi:hypothetical protein
MYEGARMAGPLDSLRVMQRRACLWITGSFKTSPRGAAETLAGIPPIHLHVQKWNGVMSAPNLFRLPTPFDAS